MPRLPQPGGDAGNWGTVLNEYLLQIHNADGTLKDNSVSTSTIQAGAISAAKLDQDLINQINAATGGVVTLSGDITGQATSNTIAAGKVTTTKLADGAVTTSKLADEAVTASKLDSAIITTINSKADTSALANYIPLSQKAANNGVASLDATGKVPTAQLPATSTTVASTGITDSTATGRSVLTATDAAAARTAIGAGTGNSNLTLGTTSATAKAGDYAPTWDEVTGKPTIPAQFNPIAGTNVTLSGTYPDITFSATPGAGVTDLSTTTAASDVTIVSSTGTDAVIAGASTTAAGVLTSADKTKLDGIAAGATANATDAQLRDRSTHTGTQSISTVTNLQTTLDGKVNTSDAALATKGGVEAVQTVTASTATTALDLNAANVFDVTLNATTALSIDNATSGKACSCAVYLKQGIGGNKTVTWPSGTKWSGGAPTLSTAESAVDIVVFETIDGGTTWYASLVGLNFS